ncbi:hypothetical protein [Paraburkholderia bannensis]|uniref:hypothetical protein n=1 Tax=Paraburkholderia bannensis TaxID=765414 RepID=UPI002AAF43FD|nr:hypothetical protein [Paraburkholderia bannensis]
MTSVKPLTANKSDPVQQTRALFLDFVDAACGDMSSLNAVVNATRTTLSELDDDALMITAARAGQPEYAQEAVRLCAAVARLSPQRVAAWFAAGLALQLANRHADAVAPYRHALAIDRTFPNLRNNLATALIQVNSNADEVAALLAECVEANPDDANAWINLSRLRATETDITRPVEASRRAVALAPHSSHALNNYAMACKEAQQWDEAERAASAACQYAPNDASVRVNLSMTRLVRGKFAQGWADHELRWQGSSELATGRPVFPRPEWRGEPLAGRTLLVWGEQGMGDLLQFSRYIPMLAERVHREGGKLVWNSFPQMGALLARSMHGHYDLYTAGGPVEALPPFDCEISLVSLPCLFGTAEETIPGPLRYLSADAAAAAHWRERLSGETRLKVGLTWTGSLTHKRNPFRRVGLERLAQHFGGIDNVAFYSLQPGAQADIDAARNAGFEVIDYTGEWKDFDDTAAFIDALDLVISVCTSAAHLAGALGQRAWVLLDVNPHWVWLLDRRDSPWYPNTTLYRQKHFRQWDPVLEEMGADLARLAAAHRAKQA